jgi:hypothetical protein
MRSVLPKDNTPKQSQGRDDHSNASQPTVPRSARAGMLICRLLGWTNCSSLRSLLNLPESLEFLLCPEMHRTASFPPRLFRCSPPRLCAFAPSTCSLRKIRSLAPLRSPHLLPPGRLIRRWLAVPKVAGAEERCRRAFKPGLPENLGKGREVSIVVPSQRNPDDIHPFAFVALCSGQPARKLTTPPAPFPRLDEPQHIDLNAVPGCPSSKAEAPGECGSSEMSE